jgi:small subunit ribosomal protein S4
MRRGKALVGYGQQLREKQKVKRIYFVLEGQFRNYFEKAARQKGITGENLLSLLERRLDNAVYRTGFSTSRRQARQLVNHGHIEVNGRKVDIPSFQVKVGDIISVREGSRKNPHIEGAWQTAAGRGRPGWVSPAEGADMSARIASLPTRDDIDRSINEQLIVELYSK